MINENNLDYSLRAQVFKKIETWILDGTLAPGDALAEIKLSQQLGVSRTPVREALRQLELEGLVKTVPNKGAVVIGISKKDIDDIYTIRMYVEGLAAKLAVENITDKEIGLLEENVELQVFYVKRGDIAHVYNLDKSFHEILYNACKSRPLNHTLSNFHNYIQKARETSFFTVGRATVAVEEHRQILEAIKLKNSEMAERLTAQHVKNARKNLIENV